MIQLPEGFDSIFRYIVVVSQRAEQLVNGAKPRSESRHDKSTLVAIDDVDEGKVEWRILTQAELDARGLFVRFPDTDTQLAAQEGRCSSTGGSPDIFLKLHSPSLR